MTLKRVARRKASFVQLPGRQGLGVLLTSREWEVLELICEGKVNDEIAAELEIRSTTVKYHAKNLYDKLGVKRRTEAAVVGIHLGMKVASICCCKLVGRHGGCVLGSRASIKATPRIEEISAIAGR